MFGARWKFDAWWQVARDWRQQLVATMRYEVNWLGVSGGATNQLLTGQDTSLQIRIQLIKVD